MGKYLWLVFFHILHIPEGSGVLLGSEGGGVPVVPMNNCIHRGQEKCVWPRILRKKKTKNLELGNVQFTVWFRHCSWVSE